MDPYFEDEEDGEYDDEDEEYEDFDDEDYDEFAGMFDYIIDDPSKWMCNSQPVIEFITRYDPQNKSIDNIRHIDVL